MRDGGAPQRRVQQGCDGLHADETDPAQAVGGRYCQQMRLLWTGGILRAARLCSVSQVFHRVWEWERRALVTTSLVAQIRAVQIPLDAAL